MIGPNDPATAIMLVGPPGSGKSTWRHSVLATVVRPTVILSTDDVIEQIAAKQGRSYTDLFPTLDYGFASGLVWHRFRRATQCGHDVIIDHTNLTRKSRKNWLRGLPEGYRRVAVVFSVAEDELRRRLQVRAEQTGKHIPDDVVNAMLQRYQAPTLEDFDAIQSV